MLFAEHYETLVLVETLPSFNISSHETLHMPRHRTSNPHLDVSADLNSHFQEALQLFLVRDGNGAKLLINFSKGFKESNVVLIVSTVLLSIFPPTLEVHRFIPLHFAQEDNYT